MSKSRNGTNTPCRLLPPPPCRPTSMPKLKPARQLSQSSSQLPTSKRATRRFQSLTPSRPRISSHFIQKRQKPSSKNCAINLLHWKKQGPNCPRQWALLKTRSPTLQFTYAATHSNWVMSFRGAPHPYYVARKRHNSMTRKAGAANWPNGSSTRSIRSPHVCS